MNLMIFFSISGLLNGVTSFGLGLFVFLKSQQKLVHRLYFLFTLSVAVWCTGYFLWPLAQTKSQALFAFRVLHEGAIFIPIFYYHFVTALSEKLEVRRKSIIIGYCLAVFFAFIVPTKLYIYDMVPKFVFKYWAEPGILYHFYLAYFVLYAFLAINVLWNELKSDTQLEKKRSQYKYVLLATIIGYVGGATNYPLWYDIPIYPVANGLVSIYVALIAYAIIRHNLLDIEVIIKRTLVFTGLVGSVVAVVSLMAFISQDLLVRFIQIPRWLSNIITAVVIAGLYGPMRNWLVNVTDRFLFQKKYDYRQLLNKFTDEVMTIVDLKQLVQTTVKTLSETVKLGNCQLLLHNKDTQRYELVAAQGLNGQQVVLDEQEPFITFLHRTQEPIALEGELSTVRFPETVTSRMRQLRARLCLPLQVHDELKGVLCLGPKKSDEEFTKDELDIFLPLARTLGMAVSNAQLFEDLAKTQAEAAQREKLAVIGTLSAGINHEICNPLGIVKAQCEAFLLDQEDGILEGKSPEQLLDRTASIMQGTIMQIDRATAITQKLSSFAKPIKEATQQPVSVEREVEEVLVLVGHDLRLEKIDVRREIEPHLPKITADQRQIQEVLFNLIRNAGQAITPPGTITIRTYRDGQRVRVEIQDTGAGIPAEKLGQIFDPFFTTKEPGKGTGLGLYIVRQMVERNQGRISVKSTVGQGTTFTLRFPVAEPAMLVAAA